MLIEPQPVEYQTMVVGAAPLVKRLLDCLGVAQAIDSALCYQPTFRPPMAPWPRCSLSIA